MDTHMRGMYDIFGLTIVKAVSYFCIVLKPNLLILWKYSCFLFSSSRGVCLKGTVMGFSFLPVFVLDSHSDEMLYNQTAGFSEREKQVFLSVFNGFQRGINRSGWKRERHHTR